MVRNQESMDNEEKLRKFSSFSLVKRQWSVQIVVDNYLWSGKDNRARPFPVMTKEGTVHRSCRAWIRH